MGRTLTIHTVTKLEVCCVPRCRDGLYWRLRLELPRRVLLRRVRISQVGETLNRELGTHTAQLAQKARIT